MDPASGWMLAPSSATLSERRVSDKVTVVPSICIPPPCDCRVGQERSGDWRAATLGPPLQSWAGAVRLLAVRGVGARVAAHAVGLVVGHSSAVYVDGIKRVAAVDAQATALRRTRARGRRALEGGSGQWGGTGQRCGRGWSGASVNLARGVAGDAAVVEPKRQWTATKSSNGVDTASLAGRTGRGIAEQSRQRGARCHRGGRCGRGGGAPVVLRCRPRRNPRALAANAGHTHLLPAVANKRKGGGVAEIGACQAQWRWLSGEFVKREEVVQQ